VSAAPPADPAAQITASFQSMLPDLGLGGLLGLAAGYAVRVVGRVALLVVGLAFIVVQLLAHYGVVTVDWLQLQTLTEPWLREGRENFGGWFSRVFLANLPFAGAFAAGFVLGLRLR
jgi:Uncharacterized conserved protein